MDARRGPGFSVVIPNIPSSSPRPFRFVVVDTVTRSQLLLGGFFALFGLLVSVILTVEGGPFWNDLVLDRRGVDAQGTPTSIEPTGHAVNGRRFYRVAYTFMDRTGAWRVGSGDTMDPGTIARAKRNEPLAINYDPRAPGLSRLKGESASSVGVFPVLITFGFGLVGSTMFAIGLRRALRMREIYVHGRLVRARVTAVSPSKMSVNDTEVMWIDYAFDAPTGRMSGRTRSVTPPQLGDAIWVVYDPYEPERSIVAS